MSEINKSRSMMRLGFFIVIICVAFLILCVGATIIVDGGKSDFNWLGVSEFILSVAALYVAGATGKYFQKRIENNTQN